MGHIHTDIEYVHTQTWDMYIHMHTETWNTYTQAWGKYTHRDMCTQRDTGYVHTWDVDTHIQKHFSTSFPPLHLSQKQ